MSLQLRLPLDPLPSPQHRAGLAGLCLLLPHLDAPHEVLPHELHLTLDHAALGRLFAHLYQSITVTRKERTELRPTGSWLASLKWHESTLALWQDSIWYTLRGTAGARGIYQNPGPTASNLWKALEKEAAGRPANLKLSGSILVGARGANAEGHDLRVTPSHTLLLHFAHAVATPYRTVNEEGEFAGTVWVFPDLDDLTTVQQTLECSARPQVVAHEWEAGQHLLAATGVPRALCARLEQAGHDTHLKALCTVRREPGLPTTLPSPALRAMVARSRSFPYAGSLALLRKVGVDQDDNPRQNLGQSARALLDALPLEGWETELLDWLEAGLTELACRDQTLTLDLYRRGGGSPRQRTRLHRDWVLTTRHLSRQIQTATSAQSLRRTLLALCTQMRRPPSHDGLQAASQQWKRSADLLALGLLANAYLSRP